MNKYRNGKIYKLIDLTNDNIYIGSTIETLDRRLKRHIYYIKEVYSHRNGKRHMKSKKHINYLLECP